MSMRGEKSAHETDTLGRESKVKPLWRNRDYMLLLGGQTVSTMGTNISQLAFPLLVLALTDSAAQAGIAGALRALPYVLFCLPVGALVDRWNRKRVMIVCDIGRMLSLASIPMALAVGHLTLLQLYINASIEGTLYVFFDLAETACFPRVVPKEQLPEATMQAGVTAGSAALIGPAVGGFLYGLKALLPFVVDVVSYLCSAVSLCFIRTTFQGERPTERGSLYRDIVEGLLWLWRQPLIRMLALFTGMVNLVFPDTSMLVVIVLARGESAPPGVIGLIFGVASVGSIVGSVMSAWLLKRVRFWKLVCATFWLFALVWLVLLVSRQIVVLAVVAALLALLDPVYDVAQFSRRVAVIPDDLQGRVNAAYRLMALATPPLGLFVGGLLLQYGGVIATVGFFVGCLVVMAVLATRSGALREG